MSCILKFITFTLEVKRRLWSASHPETVLQRSQPKRLITMKQVFSQRLKSARMMRGLSMDDLRLKMGNMISRQAISKYEKGLMMPESTVLIAIANALGVSVDYFFRTNSINPTFPHKNIFNEFQPCFPYVKFVNC